MSVAGGGGGAYKTSQTTTEPEIQLIRAKMPGFFIFLVFFLHLKVLSSGN
jgi:hypothetical protein